MEAEQVINYERELHEEQETVRNKILESMKDIQDGKGRDYNEFFDELEKKYAYA